MARGRSRGGKMAREMMAGGDGLEGNGWGKKTGGNGLGAKGLEPKLTWVNTAAREWVV